MEKETIDLSKATKRLEIMCATSPEMHRVKYEAI